MAMPAFRAGELWLGRHGVGRSAAPTGFVADLAVAVFLVGDQSHRAEVQATVRAATVDVYGEVDRKASASANVQLVLADALRPPTLVELDDSTPMVLAYVIGSSLYVDAMWWLDSGRPCHFCSIAAQFAAVAPRQRQLRRAYALAAVRTEMNAQRVITALDWAAATHFAVAHFNSILLGPREGVNASRMAVTLDLVSGAATEVMPYARVSCECAGPQACWEAYDEAAAFGALP